ncbi:MAG TPA: protein kinase [Feifaniaceae bacterium]|nr:protein kinase [Feifaniaceae bacterium]
MNAADIEQICLKCMRPELSGGICNHCGTKTGFVQEPAFALPAGSILHGRYLVGAVLGNGGFGITYIGYDLKEDRRVAIKEFLPTGMANRYPGTTTVSVYHTSQEFFYGLKKFLEEARVIYRYRTHGNIISVLALFEENNTAYYVMEYLEGCDLKQYLNKRGGVLPFEETLRLLLPLFDALTAIHKDGLIHRDISPDNIYICSNRQVKLLDFGAARVALMERSKSLSVILKRGYAPPEQYQTNGNQGPWTDVYALGATFYRCITGKLPPEATERLMTDTLVPPSRIAKDVPPAANEAILRALAVKTANRFESAAQFRAALTGQLRSERNIPRDVPAPPIRINPNNEARGVNMNNKILGKRFLAYLIDSLVVGVIALILSYILNLPVAIYVLLTYAACVGYGSMLEYSPARATLGKRALHLRVGDAYGQPVPNNKIVVRNLVKYSPTLGLFVPNNGYLPALTALVIFGWALLDANRQALHDKAAGTFVTEIPGYAPAQPYAQPVQQPQPAPAFMGKTSLQGTRGHYFGVEFPVQDAVVVGRNPNACGIVFPNDTPGVSGIHCEVRLDRASRTVQLTDKNSSYGTFVNGRRLIPGRPVVLNSGDTFTIGEDHTFAVVIQ